jgi:alpha-amylase
MLLFPILLVVLAVSLLPQVLAWSPFHDPHMLPGRSTIAQMFEWRFDDLARECEEHLGPSGYGGIQVSPPVIEHVIINNADIQHPWWQRYQVASYKIDKSRSGTRDQLADMISRCNAAGVRVYIDTIMNHMTASIGQGKGSAGSWYDGDAFEYPGVGYNRSHFNSKLKCGTIDGGIHNFDDFWESRNCELVGLHDLDQSNQYVKDQIVSHLNELIDMGVAGFRVDASKHMYPEAIQEILLQAKVLDEKIYGANKRPFIIHECRDDTGDGGGIKGTDYCIAGRVINIPFTNTLNSILHKWDGQRMANLKGFGHKTGLYLNEDSVTLVDNHDLARERDVHMGLSFKDPRICKMATAFMLSWPYGIPKVMSSYRWPTDFVDGVDRNNWMGPPHEQDFSTKRVTSDADGNCAGDWVCEHRWPEIKSMVEFRNVAGETEVTNWWTNEQNQIAFSRKGKAFIAFNNDNFPMNTVIKTGLPPGKYCDIISRSNKGNEIIVEVKNNGYASIQIDHNSAVPVIAIHVNARCD